MVEWSSSDRKVPASIPDAAVNMSKYTSARHTNPDAAPSVYECVNAPDEQVAACELVAAHQCMNVCVKGWMQNLWCKKPFEWSTMTEKGTI